MTNARIEVLLNKKSNSDAYLGYVIGECILYAPYLIVYRYSSIILLPVEQGWTYV